MEVEIYVTTAERCQTAVRAGMWDARYTDRKTGERKGIQDNPFLLPENRRDWEYGFNRERKGK